MIFAAEHGEERWREALDSHYKDAEYQELLQSSATAGENPANGNSSSPGVRKIMNGRLQVVPPPSLAVSSQTTRSLSGSHSQTPAETPAETPAHAQSSLYAGKSMVRTLGSEAHTQTHAHSLNAVYEAYEGFRYPPIPRPAIPALLRVSDFSSTDANNNNNKSNKNNMNNNSKSVPLEECYAGLRFLEAMLKSFANKACELRENLHEHAVYLCALSRPPEDKEDALYIESTIFANLATLYDELQELFAEMNVFTATKIHEMIDTDGESFAEDEPIYALKDSLITRSGRLSDEISLSILAIEQLVDYANSLIRFPAVALPVVESFHTHWDEQRAQYKHVQRSALNDLFVAHMMRHNLPICDAVYHFLSLFSKQIEGRRETESEGDNSPANDIEQKKEDGCEREEKETKAEKEESFTADLLIEDYRFARNELKQILLFLRIQHQLHLQQRNGSLSATLLFPSSAQCALSSPPPSLPVSFSSSSHSSSPSPSARNTPARSSSLAAQSVLHSLTSITLRGCQLSDQDCHALASCLHLFPALRLLDLSHNALSYSGIASIATNIFEHGSALRVLSLEHNRIDSDGALLLAQILRFSPSLQFLSLSFNPIHDRGLYYLLKHSLNPKRKKALHFLKKPVEAGREDDPENDDGNEDEEMLVDKKQLEARARRRYPSKCYWQDFFERMYLPENDEGNDNNANNNNRKVRDWDWVNADEDEFEMDDASEYSSDSDTERGVDFREPVGGAERRESELTWNTWNTEREEQEKERERQKAATQVMSNRYSSDDERRRALRGLSYREKLQLCDPAFSLSLSLAMAAAENRPKLSEDELSKYPKLVQRLMKLRLKLAAVAMFQCLRVRAVCDLQALHVAGCGLTERIVPIVSYTMRDNLILRDISLAHNRQLLHDLITCKSIAEMLENSAITALDLTNTGLREGGLMLIAKAMEKSPYLQRIDLSRNHFGPTAANIVANLHKTFFSDLLEIAPGHFKSAPLLHKENNEWIREMGIDEVMEEQRKHRNKERRREKRNALLKNNSHGNNKSKRGKAQQEQNELQSEDSDFIDKDIFDGDESYGEDETASAISKAMDLL